MGSNSILIVAEVALEHSDVAQIVGLYGTAPAVQLLVPLADGEPRLQAALDHLVLGELGQAWSTLRGHLPESAKATATQVLEASLPQLQAAGLEAAGQLIPGDPIAAVVQTIATVNTEAVIFITRPHLIADALHEDWSTQARRALGVPVIHFYGGTTKLLS
jgi:hypothetical protein